MPTPHNNSIVQRGLNRTVVEDGRIINVDIDHWTIDVVTVHSQKKVLDIQMGSPYLHFNKGEGIFAMPEVGAKVKVCFPSDSAPFILCFVSPFERERVEGETTSQPDSPDRIDTPTEVTYRAGRPRLQQGDIMLRCRDGNQIWLHRGGVVEIGSQGLAKRYYIPLANTIRDICENYEMLSVAGNLRWTVQRSDTSADGQAEAAFSLEALEHGQDSKASVFVKAGYVDETKRFQLSVAPRAIEMRTGVISGDAVFDFFIDEEGSVDVVVGKDYDGHIKGQLTLQIDGQAQFDFKSDLEENVTGNSTTKITGAHKMEALSSEERLSSQKVIEAQLIKLGSAGASTPVVLATPALIAFIIGHVHSSPAGPTTMPVPSLTPDLIASRKIMGE